MTGTTITSEGLDARRRKPLFRTWHRGMREMDLILGTFADSEIAKLTDVELDRYERLLDVADTVLLPWMTGEQAAPNDAMIARIIAFRRSMTF